MRATTWIQRLEGAAIAIVACMAFVEFGFTWWWLLALFLAFDASAVGYVFGPRIGAWSYNAIHAMVLPAAITIVALVADRQWALFLAPLWWFHIGVDRALGYGLKESDGFRHTHLDS